MHNDTYLRNMTSIDAKLSKCVQQQIKPRIQSLLLIHIITHDQCDVLRFDGKILQVVASLVCYNIEMNTTTHVHRHNSPS